MGSAAGGGSAFAVHRGCTLTYDFPLCHCDPPFDPPPFSQALSPTLTSLRNVCRTAGVHTDLLCHCESAPPPHTQALSPTLTFLRSGVLSALLLLLPIVC
jgi:hypothetical protein